MNASVPDRSARTYAESLKLGTNPRLLDVLTQVFATGQATEAQIKAIPVLTGRLSEQEQTAIEATMARVEQLANSRELHAFLSAGQSDRIGHNLEWNDKFKKVSRVSAAGASLGLVASVIGLAAGLVSGQYDGVWSTPFPGTLCTLLASSYGLTQAKEINAEITGYGIYD